MITIINNYWYCNNYYCNTNNVAADYEGADYDIDEDNEGGDMGTK